MHPQQNNTYISFGGEDQTSSLLDITILIYKPRALLKSLQASPFSDNFVEKL